MLDLLGMGGRLIGTETVRRTMRAFGVEPTQSELYWYHGVIEFVIWTLKRKLPWVFILLLYPGGRRALIRLVSEPIQFALFLVSVSLEVDISKHLQHLDIPEEFKPKISKAIRNKAANIIWRDDVKEDDLNEISSRRHEVVEKRIHKLLKTLSPSFK